MHKQFTSYLLPFLMNTKTSETSYLEQWACREDGWHTAAIATAVTIREPAPPIFILIFLLPMWGVVHSSALALCTPDIIFLVCACANFNLCMWGFSL